ncbi:hypothetical protein [Paractinoplanes atraurantiacus]|uniref:Uncharacterized protein n=1 Tax=Paractinoplanes atraurantiacus TaxID=1036182 RepID=A0A285J515_9ACTN|nr:hypothetical protein [Actinoplanes atraurantiacus]SNY55419.1 hypothetical protein SAMN05421748_116136 [Actinoplanes atraurantiacus]
MNSERPPRKSVFQRIRDWFRGEPPAVPEQISYRPPGQPASIAAMCRGDVHEFTVSVEHEWTGDNVLFDEVVRMAEKYHPSVEDEHRRRVWQIARNYGPHEAAETERVIQRDLGTTCYPAGAGQVRCTSYFRVTPDPRVREHLNQYVLREVDADSEAELARQRVRLARELTLKWSGLLTELGVSPVKLSAAALADPRFSAEVDRLAGQRRLLGQELAELLANAAKDHGQLGMYEIAEFYASLVADYQSQMEKEDREFISKVMNTEPPELAR